MIDPEVLIARMSKPVHYPSFREGLDELFDNVEDAIDAENWRYLTDLMEKARLAPALDLSYGVSIVRSCYRVKERFSKSWAMLVLELQKRRPPLQRSLFDVLVRKAELIMEAG